MNDGNLDKAMTFHELLWDTEFFGVTCAKAILNRALTRIEWDILKENFGDYQFISIENRNSDPINSQLIGRYTTAFLVDVNIQFKKKLEISLGMSEAVEINQAMARDERILEIADFSFSKFIEDPELAKRGGAEVYRQWLINSFGKEDKFFAVSEGTDGEINGFLLHSYSNKICTVELIAVSSNATKSGIGTSLFSTVEYSAYKNDCHEIRVGTQVRNASAINFYHKNGCKQVECNQVYHLWNL